MKSQPIDTVGALVNQLRGLEPGISMVYPVVVIVESPPSHPTTVQVVKA